MAPVTLPKTRFTARKKGTVAIRMVLYTRQQFPTQGGKKRNNFKKKKKFKKRYCKHKASLAKKTGDNSTTLSSYFWSESEAGREPRVKWMILEKNIPTFNSVRKECRLCIREKFNIAFCPQNATLNSRNEIFGHCRHIRGCLIDYPPD